MKFEENIQWKWFSTCGGDEHVFTRYAIPGDYCSCGLKTWKNFPPTVENWRRYQSHRKATALRYTFEFIKGGKS